MSPQKRINTKKTTPKTLKQKQDNPYKYKYVFTTHLYVEACR